jgi:AraC family transcriptional regulator
MIESKQLNTDYTVRINKTLDYIEHNLENSITLEDLADAANFSKFHFNRIFHSMVGETPFQFVSRLRLEKAASLIAASKNSSIYEISLKCGFSDISVFSRNFKNYFKIPASQYRKERLKNSNISQLNSNTKQQDDKSFQYVCHTLQTIEWRTNMELNKSVEVKELSKMTVAYVRNIGPWNGDQEQYHKLRNKLFSWAGARGLMGGKDFKYLILYHDDPNVALSDKLRMSLCITIPPETNVDGEIGKMEIEAAKYAIARFELTVLDFQKAWDWIYGQWLPNSGYQPDAKPYFETYPEEPKGDKFIVDFCIPVIPA